MRFFKKFTITVAYCDLIHSNSHKNSTPKAYPLKLNVKEHRHRSPMRTMVTLGI